MNFSIRNGIVAKELQIESMTKELQNSIFNIFTEHILDDVYYEYYSVKELYSNRELDYCTNSKVIKKICSDFFYEAVLNIEESTLYYLKKYILKKYINLKWNKVFDFIEFCIEKLLDEEDISKFIVDINECLEHHVSGYRVVNNNIVQIISDIEIESIEKSLNNEESAFNPVKTHIQTALKQLSTRDGKADYRNSIKESITAVEGAAKVLVGNNKSSLGDLLNTLRRDKVIDPIIADMFKKVYGYASDKDGIRHALNEETKVGLEDAIFWLVHCSSFVNYLIEKYRKLNVKEDV